jgi:hypothetical protein
MAETDVFPRGDADFDGRLAVIATYVTDKTDLGGPWVGYIPAEKVATLNEVYNDWHTAYEKTRGPHTSVDTKLKKGARKAAEAFIRPFIAQYLMFPPVTDADREAMGLHNRDTTRTTIPVPATRPVITELKPLGGFQVQVRFRDETTPDSKAVPYGDNGCLLYFTWGEEQVTDYDALLQTQLMTHNLWVLTFPPEARGKFLSCAARWQNDKSELGPRSEIQHIMIM